MATASLNSKSVFDVLGGFARRRAPTERCDLCGVSLPARHPHLLSLSDSGIVCGCDPCATLFAHRDGARRFLRIPRDAHRVDGLVVDDAAWAALRLPIDLAFFVRGLPDGRMTAYYPSPAGCIESQLELEAWSGIEGANPVVAKMSRGVEALLADRTRGQRRYWVTPIDQCYRLAGMIRISWRGFSGGEEVWRKVDEFFRALGQVERA
jgi:hypothetical protein